MKWSLLLQVHAFGGTTGVLFYSLMASKNYVYELYGKHPVNIASFSTQICNLRCTVVFDIMTACAPKKLWFCGGAIAAKVQRLIPNSAALGISVLHWQLLQKASYCLDEITSLRGRDHMLGNSMTILQPFAVSDHCSTARNFVSSTTNSKQCTKPLQSKSAWKCRHHFFLGWCSQAVSMAQVCNWVWCHNQHLGFGNPNLKWCLNPH